MAYTNHQVLGKNGFSKFTVTIKSLNSDVHRKRQTQALLIGLISTFL